MSIFSPIEKKILSLHLLSNQATASVGIYGCMLIYVLLWVFPDYQAGFLVFGSLLKAITIPYFLRINEKPVVQEALFLICGDLIGITLNLGSVQSAAMQCRTIFGL